MEDIRVLLIEDNPGDALLIEEMLGEKQEEVSFTLVWEDRLSGGIRRLTEGFDIVLLDLTLPDSKGLNTLLNLQRQAQQIPVIITTGLADEALAIRAVRSGAQDYLVKGKIDSNYLVRSIRYAIARRAGTLKTYSAAELLTFDGKDGKPAYIAFKGNVYDATNSKLWKNARHAGKHLPGHDLTADISGAPHGEDVLLRLSLVGELSEEESLQDRLASWLESLHLHPMIVHFPIAYSLASAFFVLLYLPTCNRLFENISFYMLILSAISIPFAALTGLFSWKVTYHGESSRIFSVKIILTVMMFLAAGVACLWRLLDPSLLTAADGPNYIYLLLILGLQPLVVALGHYGGKLVYP